MDFKNVDVKTAVEKGLTITIKDLDLEDTDCKVTVLGVGSAKHKAAEKRIEAARNRASRQKRELDEDELEELHIDLLVDCTLDWENVEEDGKQVEFNPTNARRMFAAYPVLTNQVLAGIYEIRERLAKN
jgi:predicted glycosyl hydrolase (DUF1957 family)